MKQEDLNVVFEAAAERNQAEIVKTMLKSSCIERKAIERALSEDIDIVYAETLRVLIDDDRTPFCKTTTCEN
jgi:hypothetical protein